jgi:hypothetical protein
MKANTKDNDTMTKKPKMKITPRAALQRINRALKPGEILKKSRRDGLYYVIDYQKNYVKHEDVDLTELGRTMECIALWEEVES